MVHGFSFPCCLANSLRATVECGDIRSSSLLLELLCHLQSVIQLSPPDSIVYSTGCAGHRMGYYRCLVILVADDDDSMYLLPCLVVIVGFFPWPISYYIYRERERECLKRSRSLHFCAREERDRDKLTMRPTRLGGLMMSSFDYYDHSMDLSRRTEARSSCKAPASETSNSSDEGTVHHPAASRVVAAC